MIVHIALIEDESQAAETFQKYLNRYEQENHMKFKVTAFSNAIPMLENYTADYDIIFMDIRMPYMNGMDAAHRLRAIDPTVILIFITSLTQYAIAGYEVAALDYIVKPVNYYDFALKLARAIDQVPTLPAPRWITVSTDVGRMRLALDDIRYVETDGHHVIFHTLSGDYRQYNSLTSLQTELKSAGFARCNSCYLVNLQYVKSIKGFTVFLDDRELRISQQRKKAFLQSYTEWHNYSQT